jgi:gliding motility-associated-like protein
MKTIGKALSGACMILYAVAGIAQNERVTAQPAAGAWVNTDLFDQKVFVANKGQHDRRAGNETVFYSARSGNMDIYFTGDGIVYRYDSILPREEERDERGEEEEEAAEKRAYFFRIEWKGARAGVKPEGLGKKDFPYTYVIAGNTSIVAPVYSGIIYRDLYPGIDMELLLPANGGLKYNLVVHPGADLSKVRFVYPDANNILSNSSGDLQFFSAIGKFTDHAPVSFYENENANVPVRFLRQGKEISFDAGGYDKNKTLIIDPWVTNPVFTINKAYDIDYDLAGNVYAYGSGNPFQLIKLDNAGNVIWVFNNLLFNAGAYNEWYGDFTVDEVTQSVYIVEGSNIPGGARVLKLNQAGVGSASYAGLPACSEMWRCDYNSCLNQLVIGAGSFTSPLNACIIDSALTSPQFASVFGSPNPTHDVNLFALDPSNASCYMAAARSASVDPVMANNTMVKCPLPAFIPTTFSVSDGYNFVEVTSVNYVGIPGNYEANGFNGMAVSFNWLYTYNGSILKRWNKNTGALVSSINTGGINYQSGGLSVDECDNIYVGVGSSIKIYDSSLVLTGTIALPNTVYDVKLGPRNKIYACGIGFVTEITKTPAFTITATLIQPSIGCGCTGSASSAVCGNTANYTYQWSGGQTTVNASGLCAGTHTVTVTTYCNFTYTDTVTVPAPPPLAVSAAQTNLTCNGGNNGSATATVSGGNPVYTYTWSPSGGNSATATNLSAGTYSVVVTDTEGCTITQTFLITQPPLITATFTSTDATCGNADGSASITASGGSGNLAYQWNPSGQTTTTATNLAAGTYTCTITDSLGCTATFFVGVNSLNGPVLALSSQSPVTCFGGNDGSVSITANGGAPPYIYQWTPSGGNNSSATGLSAGNYICTVTDSAGCVQTITVAITQPPMLTAALSSTDANCGNNNGTANITASGGTGNYIYVWTPGNFTTASINSLSPGVYYCTTTDSAGCGRTDSVTIQTLNGPVVNLTHSDVTCFAACNGSASVNVTGGSSPISYNWSPSGGNTANAINLCPGNYTCTVTDSAGCSVTVPAVITEPSQLLVSMDTIFNVACAGDSSGAASVTVAGGTIPYNYSWFPYGGVQSNATSLVAGNYICTVTDAKGCSDTISLTVSEPAPLTLSSSFTATTCGEKNGSATVNANGGTNPYSYVWNSSPSQFTSTADSLDIGTYMVDVTDNNGCMQSDTITVTGLPAPTATLSLQDAACFNSCNGSATVNATGTGPFTFTWSTGGNSATENNLCAGNYSVIFTDSTGCSDTLAVLINQPAALTVAALPDTAICSGQPVTLSAIAQGGTGGYNYNWNPGGSGQTIMETPVSSTIYIVTSMDANGCSAADSVDVTVNPLPAVSFVSDVTDGCPVVCITFTNTSPNAISAAWNFGDGNTSVASNPVNCYTVTGQYDVTLTISDNNGCSNSTTIIGMITVHPVPVAGFSATPQPATILNPTIHFTDESTGATNWSWSFGDLNASGSFVQNPVFTYPDTGHFEVVQTVSNIYGCMDTALLEIYIAEDFAFYAPNAFTPNGDGTNEIWIPRGVGIDESDYELFIFDRWGNLIFETTDPNQGWDGRANGGSEIAQVDVYVWKVELHTRADNRIRVYTGHVSLVK